MKKLFLWLTLPILVAACAPKAPEVPASKQAIVLEELVFENQLTRDCHASSLMELENGDLLCTWFGGTRESHPDVQIWVARKPIGGVCSEPVAVAKN